MRHHQLPFPKVYVCLHLSESIVQGIEHRALVPIVIMSVCILKDSYVL